MEEIIFFILGAAFALIARDMLSDEAPITRQRDRIDPTLVAMKTSLNR